MTLPLTSLRVDGTRLDLSVFNAIARPMPHFLYYFEQTDEEVIACVLPARGGSNPTRWN